MTVNGTIDTDKAYAPDVTWIFSSKGITKKVPDIQDPQIEEPEEPWEPDDPGDNPFEPGDGVYTVSELKKRLLKRKKKMRTGNWIFVTQKSVSARHSGNWMKRQ